jgi:hypothetical protein
MVHAVNPAVHDEASGEGGLKTNLSSMYLIFSMKESNVEVPIG